MDKIRYIYKITCILDNKIYIGKRTCKKLPDPKYMGSGLLIGRYIRKHGLQNFHKEILEQCSSLKELDIREKFWIKELNTLFPEGLNISTGGEAQCDLRFHPNREEICKKISTTLKDYFKNNPVSEEFAKRRAVAATGIKKPPMTEQHRNNIKRVRALQGATNKGRKFSDQWKANLSKAHKGLPSSRKDKKCSPETIQKIKENRALQIMPKQICPYCQKEGWGVGMYRFHFKNCKYK